MPKNKSKKSSQRKQPRRRDGLQTKFAHASFGMKMQPKLATTLVSSYNLYTSTGTNGFVVQINWPTFNGGQQFTNDFRYYEVTGWKVDVTLPTVTATVDSFYDGAVAVYPNSQDIGGFPQTAPNDRRAVLRLPGAVNTKWAQKNEGKWIPPPIKEVYTTDNFNSGNTANACTLLGYFDDIGTLEYPAEVAIYCDIVLYGIKYVQASTVTPIDIKLGSDSVEEIDWQKESILKQAKAPTLLKPPVRK